MRCLLRSAVAFSYLLSSPGFGGEAKEEELEPVKIELPAPMIGGGAVRALISTLAEGEHAEKPASKPRPLFLAPQGTRNVALKKPVTSSDCEPVAGELGQVTDGVKKGEEGCTLELRPGKQWVQIDLGGRYRVHGVFGLAYPGHPKGLP